MVRNILLPEFKTKIIHRGCAKLFIRKGLYKNKNIRILKYTERAGASACTKFDVSGNFSSLHVNLLSSTKQYSQILPPNPFD